MKTVFIKLKEGVNTSSQELTINSIIRLDSSFVEMTNYLDEGKLSVLIQFEHNQPITTLNLTDVTPYVLLFFDDELYFQGASYSIKNSTGSFTIQTQFRNILFIRTPHYLAINQINKLKHDTH